ncbi:MULTISPECIES: DUF4097 family beta strand repeat-containing protein [unclassified Streptomyces]|uniref:DUF4097 family beta strand repeat-containing protein n=1 Tax=unclassified Streptomyces TaxID=2593676 RepID=UPI0037F9D8DE
MARSVTARAALAVGAVVVLVGAATACASASDDQDPDHKSFAVKGGTLTIDSDDSDLEIVAADAHPAGKIEVTRWFKGSVLIGKDPKVTWSMKDGDRLVLRTQCSGFVANCATRHRVEVPRGIAVKVEGDDGGVRASGFTHALSIRTNDGPVRVSDSTGPLELRSDDGAVHADVRSRHVSAHTADGSVSLTFGVVPDTVDSGSDDGSVTVEVPRATYRVTTKTDHGSVRVDVPRDDRSTHRISATTGDGNVTVRPVG